MNAVWKVEFEEKFISLHKQHSNIIHKKIKNHDTTLHQLVESGESFRH